MSFFTPEVITALSGLVMALVALVSAIVSLRSSAKVTKALDAAKQKEYYIVCPHCKKKTPLSEVSFHMPSSEIDNNLNGKPDSEE